MKPDAGQPPAAAGQPAPPEAGVGWDSVALAVALLSRHRMSASITISDVLAGEPPLPVLAVLAAIGTTAIALLSPADQGGCVLEALGMLAAERGCQGGPGGG